MANSIAVSITADVADLTAKRAILSAELKAATKDLNDFAKTAKSSGATDELRTSMLGVADNVAKTKAQIALLDTEMKSLTRTSEVVVEGHNRMSSSGMIMQHVLRSTSDSFAAGLPPAMIFGEQIGRLGEAAALSGGSFGRLGAVLSGPWGLAITAGVAVLGPMVVKLFESNDALSAGVTKLRDDARATEVANAAHKAFSETLEGQIIEQRKLNDELERGLKTQRQLDQQKLDTAQTRLTSDKDKLAAAQRELADARSALRAAMGRSSSVDSASPSDAVDANAAVIDAEQRFSDAKLLVANLQRAVATAQTGAALAQITIAKTDVVDANDRIAAIHRQYRAKTDAAIAAADAEAQAGKAIDQAALTRKLSAIATAEAAAVKAEQRREQGARGTRSSGLSGNEITSNQARAIAEAAGFHVNSQDRTRAQQQRLYDTVRTPENPVAKPGTSAHERGAALDIAFGPGVTPEAIRKAFDAEGVKLKKLIKEAGHYHIEWSTAAADRAQHDVDEARKRANAAQQRISSSNSDTDLEIGRSKIQDERGAVSAAYGAGDINADQKLAALRDLARQETQLEIDAQEAKKAAYAGDVVAVTEATNRERVIRQNLVSQLDDLERQHTEDIRRENDRRAEATRRQAQQELQEKRRTISEIEGYESEFVRGVISGRQSLGQIVGSIALQMAQRAIMADLHYFTEHRLLTAQQLALDRGAAQGGFLAHLLGMQRKVATTVAGEAAQTAATTAGTAVQTGVHVAGEAAKTGATIVGNAARVAATATGSATSAAIVGTHNLKEITSHAATAAAAAYHAMAGIPVIGPALGAVAAAVTFAAVEGFGMLASFDKGTNMLPNDMIAQVHGGERIVPKADNQAIIAALNGGGKGGGKGDTHLHYAPQLSGDTKPFRQQLHDHSSDLMAMIGRAMRNGELKVA
ncbi:hypothetical protein BH10PSE14_BH10PSE14_06810 [soil metagenome]